MTDLLPAGVRATDVDTHRLRTHVLQVGPDDAPPLVLVHGNLSTARFFAHVMAALAGTYRVIAPDMRGFGRSERAPLDATRGLADWADDVDALLTALGVDAPPHVLGWSTGGAAVVRYAQDRPAASIVLVDPVSPYGFGGTRVDGTPCHPDFAGSGGGMVNPEVVARIAAGDASDESPLSPRSLLRSSYVAPTHREPPEREDVLIAEMLTTLTGDDNYPGDAVASSNWPGTGPGTRGILNALSPKYCDWSGLVEIHPAPPVLWIHGALDRIVADDSPLDVGRLGAAGRIPGWPGAEVFPSQPMVTQIRTVLGRYTAAGGRVRSTWLEGSGHAPHLDATDRWLAAITAFLADVGPAQSQL
jgi:pimeloyl-ACP methyl ester carboxylesterase